MLLNHPNLQRVHSPSQAIRFFLTRLTPSEWGAVCIQLPGVKWKKILSMLFSIKKGQVLCWLLQWKVWNQKITSSVLIMKGFPHHLVYPRWWKVTRSWRKSWGLTYPWGGVTQHHSACAAFKQAPFHSKWHFSFLFSFSQVVLSGFWDRHFSFMSLYVISEYIYCCVHTFHFSLASPSTMIWW